MLVKVNVTKNRKRSSDVGYRVIDTRWASAIEVHDTSYSKFVYPFQPRDRKSHPSKVETLTAVSALRTAFAATFQNNYLILPVYEDNNSIKSTTNKDFSIDNFIYAAPDGQDATLSWVYFSEGGVVSKYLVNYSLDELVELADTGTVE